MRVLHCKWDTLIFLGDLMTKCRNLLIKYFIYLVRWQLSTPILSLCVLYYAPKYGVTWATIIANLIGGLGFFWFDKIFVFVSDYINPLWEVAEDIICADCRRKCRGYRVVKAKKYDKTNDLHPEFRCEECSSKKYQLMNIE